MCVHVCVTSSQLHVHQGVGDDGQESAGERVSELLPMKILEQTGPCHHVFVSVCSWFLAPGSWLLQH